MMDHLIGLGHTRIGFVHGVARPGLAADRLFAYRRTLRAAGLPYEKALIAQCGPTPDEGASGAPPPRSIAYADCHPGDQ